MESQAAKLNCNDDDEMKALNGTMLAVLSVYVDHHTSRSSLVGGTLRHIEHRHIHLLWRRACVIERVSSLSREKGLALVEAWAYKTAG